VGIRRISILRTYDEARIAQLREAGEFFWADLALSEADEHQIARAFGLSEEAARALGDLALGAATARRIHVEEDLVVFPFWCASNTEPTPEDDGARIGIFPVKVLIHGAFLLTAHREPFDIPGVVAEGRIPPGRSERYAVYAALEGMTWTLVQALAATEDQIGELEARLMDGGLRQAPEDQQQIRNLRSRVTTLRLRLGPERALFERVGEEIELISGLESDRDDYFDRIQGQLDRAVDRADAASEALSNALQVKINETTYRLTVVATFFLPLTVVVGFFGMNFDWLVEHIDSSAAFWLLGVGGMVVPLIVIVLLLYGPRRQRRSSTTTGI
jgi:Mg2+ and Co2+ transporter CorA